MNPLISGLIARERAAELTRKAEAARLGAQAGGDRRASDSRGDSGGCQRQRSTR